MGLPFVYAFSTPNANKLRRPWNRWNPCLTLKGFLVRSIGARFTAKMNRLTAHLVSYHHVTLRSFSSPRAVYNTPGVEQNRPLVVLASTKPGIIDRKPVRRDLSQPHRGYAMIGCTSPMRSLGAISLSSSQSRLGNVSLRHNDRCGSLRLPAGRFALLKSYIQARMFQTRCSAIDFNKQVTNDLSEIIFVGTGTSEGIPRVSCLTNSLKTCPVCSKALDPSNKNRRMNTGILIRYVSSSGSSNILIDVGKFFYQSALRWFPKFGVRRIDAVVITHSHADAIGGLDDLRDWTNNVQPTIPIYVAPRDFEVMKKTHYYLVDTSVIIPGAAVSELQFNIIEEEPFVVHDLKVTPLPVWHGKGYRSLGFRFGNVCYISDVSDIPEETYLLLKDCEILILDALRPDRSSSTHFGLPRALEEVRKIRPRRTLFTGMMHLMDHDIVNGDLASLKETEGLDVQLSYDGLRIPVRL